MVSSSESASTVSDIPTRISSGTGTQPDSPTSECTDAAKKDAAGTEKTPGVDSSEDPQYDQYIIWQVPTWWLTRLMPATFSKKEK